MCDEHVGLTSRDFAAFPDFMLHITWKLAMVMSSISVVDRYDLTLNLVVGLLHVVTHPDLLVDLNSGQLIRGQSTEEINIVRDVKIRLN